ncbi:hypothetical protein C4564_06220 [Candidatus Microgenomates bacterium]|nr:MAG: hypothetical protein C4564_06220 [Candidatus Microgenomates bacterium]
MKKTLLALGVSSLVIGGLFVLPRSASAYRGDPAAEGPNCTGEQKEEMLQAFENNDYEAWKNSVQSRGRVSEVVNEDNFARFAEAHKLALQGDTDGAAQIRTELGLGLHNGSGQGQGQMRKGGSR